MMKTLKYAFFVAIIFVAAACTHNGGDINGWYGTWHIDKIEPAIYPNENTIPEGVDYYLQFQTSVICLRHTDVYHNGGESYGSWSEENGMMNIEFSGNFDVSDVFPQKSILEIVTHKGDKAQLRLSTPDYVIDYYLTRQP